MTARRARLAIAAVLVVAPLAAADDAPPTSWQFFCFESASFFASAATKAIFSIMPDPDGTMRTAQPSSPQDEPASGRRVVDAAHEAPTAVQAAATLEALRGMCYFMRVGYWTYEVCPWASVRQYHSESAGARSPTIHSEHSLGKHLPNFDDFSTERAVFTQHFGDGEDGRTCAVRYLCPDSWRDEDGIVVVHEPRPKHYVITLRVQALCALQSEGSRAGAASGGKGDSADAASEAVESGSGSTKAVASSSGVAAKTPGAAPSSGMMQVAEMILPNTRMLSSLRGRCFSTAVGYWTYEFCPQQHVRQFRKDGNRVGVEFALGFYDRLSDKVTLGVRGGLEKGFVPHTFAQTYTNGTANRKTQVRVKCSPKNEHSLMAVDEPSPHEYVFLFSSPLGCELSCAYAAVAARPPAGEAS